MVSAERVTPSVPPAVPTALRWSLGPTLLFTALLMLLLAMALWGRFAPADHPAGMPGDPEVAAALVALGGEMPIPAPGLVLVSAFAGESPGVPADSLPQARLAAAHGRLAAAARRHPGDPRLATTLAHLELASGRFERAERDYRAVLDRVPHHGEARLGLGIALAMRAGWDTPRVADESGRGPALAALAQFTNVDRTDPAHWAALYDAARLAPSVGRGRTAYAALDAALVDGAPPEWAERYRALLATATR